MTPSERIQLCAECCRQHSRWQLGQREGDPKFLDRTEPRIEPVMVEKGTALGLCSRHDAFERALREELGRTKGEGLLSPERAKEARRVAWERTRPAKPSRGPGER